jgi:hypothetical protein
MAALDLDQNEVARTERATFQDLQRVCTVCGATGAAPATSPRSA